MNNIMYLLISTEYSFNDILNTRKNISDNENACHVIYGCFTKIAFHLIFSVIISFPLIYYVKITL